MCCVLADICRRHLSVLSLRHCLFYRLFPFIRSPQFSHLVVSMFDCNGFNAINLDHFIHTCVMLNIFTDKFRCRDVHMEGIITISYEDVSLVSLMKYAYHLLFLDVRMEGVITISCEDVSLVS